MAGSVNKVILVGEYKSGLSIPECATKFNLPRTKVRNILRGECVLRTRTEGIQLASENGKLGLGLKGKKRCFSEEHKEAIRKGRLKWGQENGKGVSLKPSGYYEITQGINKGKSVHVAVMEQRIGRKLKSDEVVHHIDGNKQNNDMNNLALLTRSGHIRLHRFEDKLSNKFRERKENGRFA